MALKPCLTCGVLSPGSHCPTHRRARENARQRQTTTQRGYGTAHQQARAQLALTLPTPCGYGCGRILTVNTRWVAAHRIDGHPEHGYLASCVPCNENAKRRPVKKFTT